MNPITVLLAEDHLIVRDGLRALLKLEDGIEAGLASKLCPDFIVTDIAMPLLNGMEATRQILQITPSTARYALATGIIESSVQVTIL